MVHACRRRAYTLPLTMVDQMNVILLLGEAEAGNPVAGFFILIGLFFVAWGIWDAFKPKGWTIRHEGKTTVTPKR